MPFFPNKIQFVFNQVKDKHSTKEYTQIANKNVKRCSTSLIVTEM